ncbi:hypothetical protein M426DRAFT_268406 [Hypoxylon sp. CI-4A]|nr:hypothetical protein M426DRAFT_268406 [Hypoxylon sp. CI-4A]
MHKRTLLNRISSTASRRNTNKLNTKKKKSSKSASQIKDKQGQPIEEGDKVWTKARGGRHEGQVEQVVRSAGEAEEAGVENPPKVLFQDQHGHGAAHNPGMLEHK